MSVSLVLEQRRRNNRARYDLRADVIAVMREDLIPWEAFAREVDLSVADLSEWFKGARKSAAFEAKIREFIIARRHIWSILETATNDERQSFGERLISNVTILLSELESAPPERWPGIHDHMKVQLHDLLRLLRLMAAEPASPERLAQAIRTALRPGDRMIIARAGGAK